MLARGYGPHGLIVVQERRRGDVDRVDVVALQQGIDAAGVTDIELPRRPGRVFAGHVRYGDQFHTRYPNELLECEQAETAATDRSEPDLAATHRGLLTSQREHRAWQ